MVQKDRAKDILDKENQVKANQQASKENEQLGEAAIEGYDDINPEHAAFEDMDEVQSTDDV